MVGAMTVFCIQSTESKQMIFEQLSTTIDLGTVSILWVVLVRFTLGQDQKNVTLERGYFAQKSLQKAKSQTSVFITKKSCEKRKIFNIWL